MPIDDAVRARLNELLQQGSSLGADRGEEGTLPPNQRQLCSAWLTAAQNLVHLICPDPQAPYRLKADNIANKNHGYTIHRAVGELAFVLRNLRQDADAGLLASVADQARAETFDDFLDHADAYLQDGSVKQAGVIAGVVFEDTVRRVCQKLGLGVKDVPLENLINALKARGELSGLKAKRAKVGSDLRTRATHAQWDEFTASDVEEAIAFTRELLADKLDT